MATRRQMARVGSRLSGIRSTPTSAYVGLRGQRLVEMASPPASFGHSSSARPGARHNVTMTAITPIAQRDASQAAAYRIAALLLGVGTIHFVAPKQFDDDHPRRAARKPAVLYLRVRCRRAQHRCTGAGATHSAVRWPGGCRAVPRGLPGQHQHGPVVVGQAMADADRRSGPAAVADSDDHRGAQGPAQRLARRSGLARLVGQQRGQLVRFRQHIGRDGDPGPHVVKSCAHQRFPTSA